MAEKSSFFNSVNGDRKYSATDFAEYFRSFITNGVFPNPSTNLQIITNNDMTVILKSGKAWINGYFYYNTTDLALTIDTADGVLNRIDRVVLQYNTIERTITAKVKKGTFASSPTASVLQRDSDIYELGIADIYIGTGVTNITQSNITDLRPNTSYCGWVDSLIQADTTTLFTQLEDGFDTWFNKMKGQLSTDAAGNLQNEIDNIEADGIFKTAGGTATAITLTINQTLVNGSPVNFIASADNGGSTTTINSIPVYKPASQNPPNFKKDKPYTVVYNKVANSFFYRASSVGTALASDVRKSKTFSNDDDVEIIGTLDLSLLTSKNLKSGVTIDGVTGDSNVVDTSTGTITSGAQMLKDYKGFSKGSAFTGSIPTIGYGNSPSGCITWTNGDLGVYLGTTGYYLGGATGSVVRVPVSQIQAVCSDLASQYIVSGHIILGTVGAATVESLGGRRYATGTVTSSSGQLDYSYNTPGSSSYYGGHYYIQITSHGFTPKCVVLVWTYGDVTYQATVYPNDTSSIWIIDQYNGTSVEGRKVYGSNLVCNSSLIQLPVLGGGASVTYYIYG